MKKERVFKKNKIRDLFRPVTGFFYKIKRVINYLPIIWKGYDWDYHYSLDLFKYQLERTADYLESDKALTLDAKKHAMRIRTTIKLMERVYDDYYSVEYIDEMIEKYGKINYEFEKINNKDTYELKIYYGEKGQYTEEEQKIIREEESRLFLLSLEKQKKAERILWDLIHNNIRSWWD